MDQFSTKKEKYYEKQKKQFIMTIYQIQITLSIHNHENLSRKALTLLTQ